MGNTRHERLQAWVESLNEEKIKSLLVTCLEELIDSETIRFWDDSKAPHWDCSGEYIDGTERIEED